MHSRVHETAANASEKNEDLRTRPKFMAQSRARGTRKQSTAEVVSRASWKKISVKHNAYKTNKRLR